MGQQSLLFLAVQVFAIALYLAPSLEVLHMLPCRANSEHRCTLLIMKGDAIVSAALKAMLSQSFVLCSAACACARCAAR